MSDPVWSSRWLTALAIGSCVAAGCSNGPAESAPPPAPAVAPAAAGAGPFTIGGKVPPASGGPPSIVILQPPSPTDVPPSPAPPFMDQVQQTFIPAVLIVRSGQPVEFRNNDDVLHNVRVREDGTHSPAFNVAIPTGEKFLFTFQRDGFYDVGCDIHPAMAAQIVATTSPYVAVADREGNFSIADVPTGDYKAVVYAGAQKIERDIMVAAGQTAFDLTKP